MASAEKVSVDIADLADGIDKRTFVGQLQKDLDDTHGAVQTFQEQTTRILKRMSDADDSMIQRR